MQLIPEQRLALQVFVKPRLAPLTPVTRLLIAAKRRGLVGPCTVEVDHAGAQLAGNLATALQACGDFDGLSWTLLYNEPIVMLANATQTAGINDAVELLRTQQFIRYDRSTAVGRKVQSIIKSESIEPLEILELNSIIGIADLVRQQVGVAIVPLLKNFDWDKAPCLRVLPLPGDLAVRRVGILEQGTKSAITGEIHKLLMLAVAK